MKDTDDLSQPDQVLAQDMRGRNRHSEKNVAKEKIYLPAWLQWRLSVRRPELSSVYRPL